MANHASSLARGTMIVPPFLLLLYFWILLLNRTRMPRFLTDWPLLFKIPRLASFMGVLVFAIETIWRTYLISRKADPDSRLIENALGSWCRLLSCMIACGGLRKQTAFLCDTRLVRSESLELNRRRVPCDSVLSSLLLLCVWSVAN